MPLQLSILYPETSIMYNFQGKGCYQLIDWDNIVSNIILIRWSGPLILNDVHWFNFIHLKGAPREYVCNTVWGYESLIWIKIGQSDSGIWTTMTYQTHRSDRQLIWSEDLDRGDTPPGNLPHVFFCYFLRPHPPPHKDHRSWVKNKNGIMWHR